MFILFMISIVIIFLFSGSIQESFIETFIPVTEPKQFIENCKIFVKNNNDVQNLLKVDGCNKDPISDISLATREAINKKISCKDLVSKEIVLNIDGSTWCDRVSQLDREQVKATTITELVEGPKFMEEQHKINFGTNYVANEKNNEKYASLI